MPLMEYRGTDSVEILLPGQALQGYCLMLLYPRCDPNSANYALGLLAGRWASPHVMFFGTNDARPLCR